MPLIEQESEPATPLKKMGLIWMDGNQNAVFKDYNDNKQYFAGTNISLTNITNMAIDGNIIYVDGTNDSIGFFTTTPANESYIQLSDKFIICDTFTSAGINACIDALGADGGEVYLPEATYNITTEITIDVSNTTIIGSGNGTNLILGADISGIRAAIGIDNIILKDFLIDGNNIALSANNALIDIEGTENTIINHIHFKNFEEWALYIMTDNADDDFSIIKSCIFEDSTDNSNVAIYSDSQSANLGIIHIINCEFIDCDIGIYGADGQLLIDNCEFQNCLDNAISTANGGSYECTVSNCIFNSNSAYDIYLNNTSSWQIENNIFRNSGNTSIYFDSGSHHIITGNSFITPTDITTQINLTGSDNNVITFNSFMISANDADYHIYSNTNANNNIIACNLFDPESNVDTDQIYLTSSATGNSIFGNLPIENWISDGGSAPTTSFQIQGRTILGLDVDTIADTGDANPATHTLAPSASYVELTCNDAHTCDITMSETGTTQGQIVIITNLSTNACDFSDTANVSELAGAFAMGQYDTLKLIYLSDRWVEIDRSNN